MQTSSGFTQLAVEEILAGPGMGASASYWPAEKRVLAVGADNMAWDVPGMRDPELGCFPPGHLILPARRGIYIIENLKLDELAAAGAYRFTFVCTPLKFVGATGSPVRPVGLAPEGSYARLCHSVKSPPGRAGQAMERSL